MTDAADAGGSAAPSSASLTFTGLNELVGILAPVTADGREVWYRRHRDRIWQIQASVFRKPEHRDNERAMMARFRQEAAAAGLQYAFDEWGWTTFAQHHGLPTAPARLVAKPARGTILRMRTWGDRFRG
ncbi:MAG: FRG domain-containing protein [Chloroflexi bacterium]|nr:FRG domain-containing protein [Chloroflexota bacterium]